MSILDAKDPQSWQIGFEDGVRFCLKLRDLEEVKNEYCDHLWGNNVLCSMPPKAQCQKCGVMKTI